MVLAPIIKPEPPSSTAAPIFIADDESDDLFLIEHRLRKAGVKHPLVVFRDGEELVGNFEKIAAHEAPKPCLLLLDVNMRLIDGFDVIQWMHARPEFRALPVAVITTRASDRERRDPGQCVMM